MRLFHYRLQKILDIRAYHEREWELKLAVIVGECLKLENQLKELAVKRVQTRMQGRGAFSIEEFMTRERYLTWIDREVEKLQKQLAEKELIRAEIQAAYLEASRERKVLDKLKEHRQAQNYRFQLQEEQKVTDEIAAGSEIRFKIIEGKGAVRGSE